MTDVEDWHGKAHSSLERAARAMCAPPPVPPLEGDADPWDHDTWTAAWGRNAPLILCDRDLHGMPPAPAGMAWLATRMLVRGRRVAEVALLRTGTGATLARERCEPDPDQVAATARRLLQGITR